MRRAFLLTLVAGLLAGCSLNPVASTTGTVAGHIYGSPGCPATVQGTNCPPLLMGNLTVTFTASDGSSKVARTDLDGAYSISLAPGTWQGADAAGRPPAERPERGRRADRNPDRRGLHRRLPRPLRA